MSPEIIVLSCHHLPVRSFHKCSSRWSSDVPSLNNPEISLSGGGCSVAILPLKNYAPSEKQTSGNNVGLLYCDRTSYPPHHYVYPPSKTFRRTPSVQRSAEESISEWLLLYEHVAPLNNWDQVTKVKFLYLALHGDAKKPSLRRHIVVSRCKLKYFCYSCCHK